VHRATPTVVTPARRRVIVGGMTTVRHTLGRYGEDLAVDHLRGLGMALLDRNWRCPAGEIDAILRTGDTIVFVEVKTRRTDEFGAPAEAVGYAKQTRLRRLAAIWLARSGVRAPEVRFDVVSVVAPRDGPPRLDHIRGAF
jgi:putative endonuclease